MADEADRERITYMLVQAGKGDAGMRDKVIPLVYQELHRLARIHMSRERQDHTIRATELVNLAYLKLFEGAPIKPEDRNHFYCMAAKQMRLILVDHSRRPGFKAFEVPVDQLYDLGEQPEGFMTEIDEALKDLAKEDAAAAEVVELRFFGGYTEEQVAEFLGKNLMRVRRDWEYAKAWLYRRLKK
jgi:RNA polymerase sigma factor (TIGR02999 family)